MKPLEPYRRFEFDNTPIYIDPEQPDWFIPTAQADFILDLVKKGEPLPAVAAHYHTHFETDLCSAHHVIDRLLSRLNGPPPAPYQGRAHYRRLTQLKECWFHLTNQCTMACGHCMFSSTTRTQPALPFKELVKAVDELLNLGCRIFYFTGGEPLIYERFTDVCDEILGRNDAHVVILTNGALLTGLNTWLQRQPRDLLHFQISIDGLEKTHDAFRGKGSFQELKHTLAFLQSSGFSATLAMAVTKSNAREMTSVVDFASRLGVKNIHYLWLFLKGKAGEDLFVDSNILFPELINAYEAGCEQGISIDNVEIVKSQIFSLPGTRFDLSNAAWESLAIGPDGTVYPSPALIGESDLAAGSISEGLENVWKRSPVLERIRNLSLIENDEIRENPFKYFLGGGDIDHSYVATKTFVGGDPYTDLYSRIMLYLLAREAGNYNLNSSVGLSCRMGERLYECGYDSASVGFTHSNCVLSLPGKDGYALVKSFYSSAAKTTNEDIVNPVCYPEEYLAHIPQASRVRSYGCGSPVLDCQAQPGDVLVDLGSGAGTECFIASKLVGPTGKVYGIDMLDEMLSIAERSARDVAANLGYGNVEFRRGYLEEIPVDSNSVDVTISNCVINLSPDKRRTFSEIMRILKPGGQLCVSDIVSEKEIPLAIKYSQKLRGECIGGAMKDTDLFGMLEDLSFNNIVILNRFIYRQIEGHNFYSVTYVAYKPQDKPGKVVLYRGPFAAVITDDGQIIRRGHKGVLSNRATFKTDQPFFVLDETGSVTNIQKQNTCCCAGAAQTQQPASASAGAIQHLKGCAVCGEALHYLAMDYDYTCAICGRSLRANAVCSQGHYVCDQCHGQDALEVIRRTCLQAAQDDMIGLLKQIRSHPSLPVHGPEYHLLVVGIILSVYKNRGGAISDNTILTGIERARALAGGACSFWGICGAASGVGIAFSLILGATPLVGRERQLVMNITKDVTERISRYEAPRCCQREAWTALKAASELSNKYLSHDLPAVEPLVCSQSDHNIECIGNRCPLWKLKIQHQECLV